MLDEMIFLRTVVDFATISYPPHYTKIQPHQGL